MSNDSSILVIDSLELDSVTGGMPVPPPGGLTGQTSMNIPGGGSLTCPAGTSPYHDRIKATAAGATSLEGGADQDQPQGSRRHPARWLRRAPQGAVTAPATASR
jgi:hypothetical protein